MTPDTDFDLKSYLAGKKALVDASLHGYLPESEGLTSDLSAAMRYSLFAGGKRLRPILCIAGAEAVGGVGNDVLPVACALEMIHTYSLIHDDLPMMDDDDLRRGKPTNHKVYGEPIALLAGDGLLTEAFSVMTSPEMVARAAPQSLLQAVRIIARAAGHEGMVGGQAVDIQWEGKSADPDVVRYIHTHKTGAMISASVASGALLAGADEFRYRAVAGYGEKIGLAFQISDDILDIEGDSETMGKQAGADEKKGKMTYPAVLGLNRSKNIQRELVQGAVDDLRELDARAEPLRRIARYIIERKK
jgi:geranylgeranyl diphosphate synthase, type II